MTVVAEWPDLGVDGRGLEVGAAGLVDATELINGSNEGTDKAEVDESDKEGRAAGGAQTKEGTDGPGAGEDGDDEKDENGRGRELVVVLETIDKPGLLEKWSVSRSVSYCG